MKEISIVETEVLERLIREIAELKQAVLNQSLSRYISSKDAAAMMGFSEVWVCKNKHLIGFSKIGNAVRFRVKDIDAFMAEDSSRIKLKRRGKV